MDQPLPKRRPRPPEPRQTARRERPRGVGEVSEDRKDMAFRGYVSALAARGIQLAGIVHAAKNMGDFAEGVKAAGDILALADYPKTNTTIVKIWEAGGCRSLLSEEGRPWETGG